MRFGPDPAQQQLIREVDAVLEGLGPRPDPRAALAALGAERLLAVHYPPRYGGRGLRLSDHAVVSEHIGRAGLPDEVLLVTVQGVGCTLLAEGTREQREHWLPRIAAGDACASLLFSEREAGSDIAGMSTRATAVADGYVLSGEKAWNLHADWSAFGLCAARTGGAGGGRYEGLSLFVVPLDRPGVSLHAVPRASGDPYFSVAFDDVRLGRDALVGPEHGAWPLLVRAIGFERAGFDYLSRAQRWLAAAASMLEFVPEPHLRSARQGYLRVERQFHAARALAFHSVVTADGMEIDDFAAAYAKLACGEAAQAVAYWAGRELLPYDGPAAAAQPASTLRQALAEAPELTISGGAEELLLDMIGVEQRLSGGH